MDLLQYAGQYCSIEGRIKYLYSFIYFQLNTITTATLTTVPAVAAANCPIATAGSPTQAELLACINALRTSVNTNLVTPINAYGNPTC